ncbi:MAG: hypothetical protein OXF23_00025 [Candidatus Dadabacteria bacterium]|nr:hypothetical protein [Candidatus Dadabacteria bacterium]
MSKAAIDLIKRTIKKDYHLQRQSKNWFLANDVKLRAPGKDSLGFSLDNAQKPPFAFFEGDLPEHMAKMCDAIIALSFRQHLYLFIIEQKTSSPGEYKKQTSNGKYFCEWLFSLYKEHGHCFDEPIYIGLLIWEPRESPPKGKTSHRSKPVPGMHHNFEYFFEEKNNQRICLQKFIRSL